MFTPANKAADPAPRILVVRLSAMGDVIHALPAVATLKHSFPDHQLHWLIAPRWAPLLAHNPFLDAVIPVDRRSLSGIRDAWRALRAAPYRFAVDFQGLIQSAVCASIPRVPRIFGFHQSQVREKLAAVFYSCRVKARSPHVVDRNLELAQAAGASNVLCTFPLPPGAPEGTLPSGGFILASPLAGWPAKQWPLPYYAELAALLDAKLHLPLVLNAPEPARPLLAALPGVHLHTSSLQGLIHATRLATAVVGIDSGPLHLAAALGKPGVAIFGPTDPARNGPYSPAIRVLRSPDAVTTYKRLREILPSMRAITPRQVFEALAAQLAAARSPLVSPAP